MSWGDGVPNPFDEAKDQLLRERSDELAQKNKRIAALERFLEDYRAKLLYQQTFEGMEPAERRRSAVLIDSIERVLHP